MTEAIFRRVVFPNIGHAQIFKLWVYKTKISRNFFLKKRLKKASNETWAKKASYLKEEKEKRIEVNVSCSGDNFNTVI